MESFIQKQEKLLEAVPSKAPEGEGSREAKERPTQEDADRLGPSEQGIHPDTDTGEFSPVSGSLPWYCSSCLLRACTLSSQGLEHKELVPCLLHIH